MNPKLKKTIYILLWLILGLMLGIIIHGAIEIPLLPWANRGGEWHPFLGIKDYAQFKVIDLWMGVIEVVLGIALGFLAGNIAWRKIYIEGVRGKKYIIENQD